MAKIPAGLRNHSRREIRLELSTMKWIRGRLSAIRAALTAQISGEDLPAFEVERWLTSGLPNFRQIVFWQAQLLRQLPERLCIGFIGSGHLVGG